MRARSLGLCAVALLLAEFVGCGTSSLLSSSQNRTEMPNKTTGVSTTVPPAPAIYAKGVMLQQGRDVERIAGSVAILEQQIVGEGNDPLRNYSDYFDNREMANAIGLALFSKNNSKVEELGGPRADMFVIRLEALNASLTDLPTSAGIPASPIRYVISGHDFRYQIALKERTIAAALVAYPAISRSYVNWLYNLADIAGPNKVNDERGTAP